MSDDVVIASVRCVSQPHPVPGSVSEHCAGGCGFDVWVSKATAESMPPDARAWCLQCLARELPLRGERS